ncbi:MAG: lysine--tRNA ligase [bacterium]|nr:lysine--tRNA ligase [bacterium]
MASDNEIRKARMRKLNLLSKAGELAYPAESKRTHTIAELLKGFFALAKAGKEVTAAGRIRSLREHGGSTFFHIEDGTGSMQAYLKEDRVGEKAYRLFLDTFDIGDFLEVRGTLFETKRGEKTVEAAACRMLAKSLLPLPEKWHGLKDEEERYRKRYLDLIFNKEVREKFEKRTTVLKAIREFLDAKGFLEVETPVLQSMYGGADAKPFATHLNAFDLDMYLRISLELPLKRLVVGGIEKVYEMGRVFRNEGVDRQHNPDFTLLEFYWAYADYKDMMKLMEELIPFVVQKVVGKKEIMYEGKSISFKAPWPRVEYAELFRKHLKLDIDSLSRDALAKEAEKLGIETDKAMNKGHITDALYKKGIRPKLWEPQFVIHHPSEMYPLAKARKEDSSKAETFQLLAGGGWELVKAYSEQNDPKVQRRAFEEQESMFRKGLQEAQRMDTDFIEALEYGMPPTTGMGMGVDRLVALLTDSHSLREVILFPTMKPKN